MWSNLNFYFYFFFNFLLFSLALILNCNRVPQNLRAWEPKSPRTQEPKNLRTQEPERTREPDNLRTRKPDIKTIFIEYQICWILQEPLITAETKSSASYFTIQLIQMCNANSILALCRAQILFNLSKVPNRYNFQ